MRQRGEAVARVRVSAARDARAEVREKDSWKVALSYGIPPGCFVVFVIAINCMDAGFVRIIYYLRFFYIYDRWKYPI